MLKHNLPILTAAGTETCGLSPRAVRLRRLGNLVPRPANMLELGVRLADAQPQGELVVQAGVAESKDLVVCIFGCQGETPIQ